LGWRRRNRVSSFEYASWSCLNTAALAFLFLRGRPSLEIGPAVRSAERPFASVTDVVSESARAGRLDGDGSLRAPRSVALAAARARALALSGRRLRSRRLVPFRHPWRQPLCSCVRQQPLCSRVLTDVESSIDVARITMARCLPAPLACLSHYTTRSPSSLHARPVRCHVLDVTATTGSSSATTFHPPPLA
jgi:hypothetical protein